ncbi:unnamed protein product [Linum tenue]|uniref:Uncharacterized protein n=1 Tax=Linum tenue TaxID=586396 RepID=A0AAV0NKG3_9ROSI|nr:unnamed protein product [Linum tenue]
MLLENQVPLFVLLNLFQLTKQPNESRDFVSMVGDFVSKKGLGLGSIEIDSEGCYGMMHILSLVHGHWAPPNWRKIPQQDKRLKAGCKRIVCATKLRQAGVKLRSAVEGGGRQTFLNVQFKDGTLFIPTMEAEDSMESLLRNLIAYEQLRPRNQPSYVTYYMTLMDCLIDTRADVELLCQCGIISNHLGEDETVATLFKRLGNQVVVHHGYFTYSDVFEKVNKHCGKKWYRWVAKLRHDYFTSPWALLSLLAAFLLLPLTFIQTLYSGLSYYK